MKNKNYLLIISFLFIIFIIPILGMIKSDNEFSIIENRKLESLPDLGDNGIEGFSSKIDNYVVDQFPKRDSLLNIYTKLQLLTNKIKIRNTIVLEDWLFVRDHKVSESNLNNLTNSIKKTVNANKDKDFYYVILPSKTALLADLYPKYIDGNISRYNNEQISNKLEHIQRLDIVNIFNILIDEHSPKERKNYYYQTDFHWNAKGAFKAFELLITEIIDYSIFKATESKLRKVEYKDKYFKGDLERRFSGNIKNEDIASRYEIVDTKDLIYYTSIDDKELVDRKEIVATNIDKDEIGYNDISTYNLSCIRIINKNPIIKEKAFIMKDSYFNAMVDPISTIFSELIIIDPRYYNEDYTFTKIIEEKNPDYIFFFYHQSNVDKDLVKFLSN